MVLVEVATRIRTACVRLFGTIDDQVCTKCNSVLHVEHTRLSILSFLLVQLFVLRNKS